MTKTNSIEKKGSFQKPKIFCIYEIGLKAAKHHPITECLWNVINSVNSEFQQKKTEHQATVCVTGLLHVFIKLRRWYK
jgi:hypothetical protein